MPDTEAATEPCPHCVATGGRTQEGGWLTPCPICNAKPKRGVPSPGTLREVPADVAAAYRLGGVFAAAEYMAAAAREESRAEHHAGKGTAST